MTVGSKLIDVTTFSHNETRRKANCNIPHNISVECVKNALQQMHIEPELAKPLPQDAISAEERGALKEIAGKVDEAQRAQRAETAQRRAVLPGPSPFFIVA